MFCCLGSRKQKSWYHLQSEKAALMTSRTTLYFGYGSNLWKEQMHSRCPSSKYLGIARLNGYRWIINKRGYANVVETESEKKDDAHSYDDEVWGLVYSLEQEDEDKLDGNEGVPIAYTKENLTVDYWPAKEDGSAPVTEEKPAQTEMLVYINRELTKPHEPKEEYIYRMNMGIKDALKEGMPQGYVDQVMREYIPDRDEKI
ncbi:hypothetical protein KC318_g15691 [Hortaea werneckii]|nr:hypothetical protein KC334_g15834 [Hortaea werneckii]KAI6997111.1 hypothetical protein KC355_g10197 [Hortaea werneckii]KAI7129514.1 hypothetical protein KC324_g17156 [Hortaea werneckii]KAI7527018.1 hypothetical protein KC316_g18076 [Hortaea werneckii]KAI7651448.1 hypothetical protein KC318_g15691 [Hortaea werneckii]